MLMPSSVGLIGLKKIDPDRAQLSQMLLALLDGEKGETGLSLGTRLIGSGRESHHSEWLNCGQEVFLHISIAGSHPHVFRENRLTEMVAALDAADPILSEIEARTGLVLDPAKAVSALPKNSLVFEVSSFVPQNLVYLALSPDFVAPVALHTIFGALEIDWSEIPVAYEIQMSGPSLVVEVAAAIESGDLILIGGMAAAARLIWPANATPEMTQIQSTSGSYDMFSGQFIANDKGDTMALSATNGATGFSVPLSIRLPNRMTSAAELSGMKPGTTINIGAVTQGLPVSILVGDQEIARGELVQVGDQFGVMIEQKISYGESQSRPVEVSEVTE
jgi:flagellar motor switch/type III secretory pathway protein FliN